MAMALSMATLSSLFSSSSSSKLQTHSRVFPRNTKGVGFSSIKSGHHHQFQGLSFSHGRGFSRVSQSICAVNSDTSVPDMKDIGTTLRKAKVVIQSRNDDTIQVRVDLTGKDTQKVFDDVLTNLARTAPAIPGFRKTKGGKMGNVPKEFLVRAIGEARVTKFVIQEIISTSMTEYVEEEKLNVKKEFKTIQKPEELESQFEPGKSFGFNATLDIEKLSEMTTSSSSDV